MARRKLQEAAVVLAVKLVQPIKYRASDKGYAAAASRSAATTSAIVCASGASESAALTRKRNITMARRKLQDAAVVLAVRLVQPTKYRASDKGYAAAAALLGNCSPHTVAYYMMRIEHPHKYAQWIKNKKRQGFEWRGTAGKNHRKPPKSPSIEEIKVALAATDGDCRKAARLLDCSKTPVRNYILDERAAGRECGRYKVTGYPISKALPKNAKSRPLTENDLAVSAALAELMGDDMPRIAA